MFLLSVTRASRYHATGDRKLSRCMRMRQIVRFHMTSLKFKLQNYRSYWDFTFMKY